MQRSERKSRATKLPNKQVKIDPAGQIIPILKDWNIPKEDLSEVFQATQRSLDTVTHLTEYEDDKANRTLTAMAFMSAFAAVIFVVIPARYPLSVPLTLIRAGYRWEAYLLSMTYAAFIIYALTLTIGVAIVLHAVRPSFNVPKKWKPEGSKPGSHLFFAKIIEVSPADWATAFTNSTRTELLSTYARNSVLETYLIAEKIVVKMKWLSRGVRLFVVSTIVLAVLLPLVVATVAFVPAGPEQLQQASQQQAVASSRDGSNAPIQAKQQDVRPDRQAPIRPTPSGKVP